jgi:hypothetical protein
MKDLGKGLATIGIWGAVVAVGWKEGELVLFLGIFATIGTYAVWE